MQSGKLQKNPSGRWSIGEDCEITSGEIIEVKVGEFWISTRIEHGPDGYYAVSPLVCLCPGMEARLIPSRTGPPYYG